MATKIRGTNWSFSNFYGTVSVFGGSSGVSLVIILRSPGGLKGTFWSFYIRLICDIVFHHESVCNVSSRRYSFWRTL